MKVAEAFRDICNDEECERKLKLSCYRMKKCGHPCCGTNKDEKCIPCLFEEC